MPYSPNTANYDIFYTYSYIPLFTSVTIWFRITGLANLRPRKVRSYFTTSR